MKSGSGLKLKEMAEIGVAVIAEVISEGKVAVTGVVSFPNLGLVPAMMIEVAVRAGDIADWWWEVELRSLKSS